VNFIIKILKIIILYIVNNQHYYIAALILRVFIRERTINGKNKTIYSKANDRLTILALDSDRYRGDLEMLASVSKFRVLTIRQKWQVLFLGRIYSNINNVSLDDYFGSISGDSIYKEVVLAKKFMQESLIQLLSIIKVDCITTVNYKYIEDLDWTIAAKNIGIPYIMLYRECLLQKGYRFYDEVVKRNLKYKFYGSHIIVHNHTCKDAFLESNYCKEKDISVIGALRMDKYLNILKNRNSQTKRRKKQFVLFYFPYDMSLFGKNGNPPNGYKYKYAYSIWRERKSLFRDVHVAIAELAVEHPEINFIIKPKEIMMNVRSWLFYEQVLDEIEFNKEKADNYSVEPYADVHELILNSDIICALQSSTAIESAISGKPVILPVFKNYRITENYKDFTWRNHLDIFSVANNKSHLKEMIIDLMNHPIVDGDILNKRKSVFKEFFNDIEGESLNKYVETITEVVEGSK
jgi:hypothetical protein